MATALETLNRKALKGVIREILPVDGIMNLISAEVNGQDGSVASELPVEEVKRLNLQVGDELEMLPIDFQTYLIIGKPKP